MNFTNEGEIFIITLIMILINFWTAIAAISRYTYVSSIEYKHYQAHSEIQRIQTNANKPADSNGYCSVNRKSARQLVATQLVS